MLVCHVDGRERAVVCEGRDAVSGPAVGWWPGEWKWQPVGSISGEEESCVHAAVCFANGDNDVNFGRSRAAACDAE